MSISQRLQSNSRVRTVPFCKRRYRGSLCIGLILRQWPNSCNMQYLQVMSGGFSTSVVICKTDLSCIGVLLCELATPLVELSGWDKIWECIGACSLWRTYYDIFCYKMCISKFVKLLNNSL